MYLRVGDCETLLLTHRIGTEGTLIRLSTTRVRLGLSKPYTALLASALLSASCTTPNVATDRVAVSSQAIAKSGAAVLSPEIDLDRTPSVERARSCPQAAFGTTSYLVTHEVPQGGQIGATRFDRAGSPLQAFDIPGAGVGLSSGFRGSGCAPVVFAGGAFIALWVTGDGTLSCTRIAEDGTLLGGVNVATGLAGSSVESVVFDGSHVLASLFDGKVALVGTDCSAVTAPVALPVTAGATHYPMGATFDGTQYWIAYSERLVGTADRFLVQAVSIAGAPSGTPITVATAPWVGTANSAQYIPAVQGSIATGGGKTELAYSVYLNIPPTPPDLRVSKYYLAQLSSTGIVSNVTEPPNYNNPVIGFAGDGFAFYTNSPFTAALSKVVSDGTVVQSSYYPPGIVSSFARDGSNLLVVSAGADIQNVAVSHAQLLGPDLQPIGAPSPLQHMSERHAAAAIATAGETSLAVWRGCSASVGCPGTSDHTFWGSRLTSDGTVLDPKRLELIPGSQLEAAMDPAIASDGTDFLLSWGIALSSSSAQQRARFVNGSSGELGSSVYVATLTSSLNDVQPYGYASVLASNGSDYLIVWGHGDLAYEEPNLTASFSVEAARVTSSGEVLDAPPLLLRHLSNSDPQNVRSYLGEIAIAYDGAQYVVVSHVGELPDSSGTVPLVNDSDAPIIVQHVSAAGEVGPALETPWRGSLGPAGNPPSIAWGGGEGLVTFRNQTGLFAGRLNTALEPLDDPATLVTNQLIYDLDWRSSVAWDGSNYWVSWKAGRGPTFFDQDLYVARVSPAGVLLDPSGTVLSSTANFSGQVGGPGGVLTSGNGRALAAYTRFDPAPDVYNFTIHARWLSSGEGGEGGEGGEAGANNGSSGAANAGGGTVNGEAGSSAEAGSPNDDGGAAGTSTTHGGASATAGRSGGTSSSGGTAGVHTGGSSSSPPHGSGCSIGSGRDRSNLPLFWLALLMLPLTRSARRRAAEPRS